MIYCYLFFFSSSSVWNFLYNNTKNIINFSILLSYQNTATKSPLFVFCLVLIFSLFSFCLKRGRYNRNDMTLNLSSLSSQKLDSINKTHYIKIMIISHVWSLWIHKNVCAYFLMIIENMHIIIIIMTGYRAISMILLLLINPVFYLKWNEAQ